MGKKVFSVYMGDPDSSSHSELDLPATPWELIDALDKLRLEDGRESYWQVEDIGRYGFLAPLLDDSDLYQFNALAEQLSTFDHVEAIAFEGLVQMEVDKLCQTNGGELTLQRLLDLAYSVDGCHVVPEVRDDAALGRFYVENDFLSELEQVPDSVLELLDYAKIGEKMRRDEHGAMTPNGYVVREAELRQAPPNLGRPPRKPPYMIHFLCVSDVRAVKLYLPAKQAELDAVLDCLEVDSWQEVQLEECDTAMPEMWAFVDMAHTSMEQVNQFAQCLEIGIASWNAPPEKVLIYAGFRGFENEKIFEFSPSVLPIFQSGLGEDTTWRVVRVVEGATLEKSCAARHLGFESLTLRQPEKPVLPASLFYSRFPIPKPASIASAEITFELYSRCA